MNEDWMQLLMEMWFAREKNHYFDIRPVYYDRKEKNHFTAKMKLHGSRGKIMAKATGKTANEAIENLIRSKYRGTDKTVADIIGKTVADIMGINAEQADNQN